MATTIQLNTSSSVAKFVTDAILKDTVYDVALNCNISNKLFNDFTKQITSCKNLRALTLSNLNISDLPKDFYKLPITNLALVNCKQLNVKNVFDDLYKLTNLQELTIDNCTSINIGANAQTLKKLTSLTITNMPNIQADAVISAIANYPLLSNVNLSYNNIIAIPDDIKRIKKLTSLNLSNNLIAELTPELAKLKELNTLKINNNPLLNELEEVEKLKSSPLKNLYMDDVLNADEKKKLDTLIANTKIIFIEEPNEDDTLTDDTLTNTAIKNPLLVSDTVKSGSFEIKKKFKVLSDAYLTYPTLFRNIRYNFDSLLMEQRYLDSSYSNGWKNMNGNSRNSLRIWKDYDRPGTNKETWFHLPKSSDIALTHPELMTYTGMYWVYKGDLSKKKFYKKYLCKKTYTDIRLYYNDLLKEFEIELKTKKGFEKFTAYVRDNTSISIETSQKNYIKKNARYSKALGKRIKKFDTKNNKNKIIYTKQFNARIDQAWAQLKTLMSAEEKKMTRPQWLAYYTNVIAEEQLALANAPALAKYLNKSLLVSNYVVGRSRTLRSKDTTTIFIRPVFKSTNNKGLAVNTVFVINEAQKTFVTIAGSLTSNNLTLPIPSAKTSIIVELIDGNLACISYDELNKLNLINNSKAVIKLTSTNKQLTTIAEIYKLANLSKD
ncbi:MAG: hypothetical protein ABL940_08610 [Bacteroidia bacterium]